VPAAGTTTELNLADYFRANNMKFSRCDREAGRKCWALLRWGRCDAFTTDHSASSRCAPRARRSPDEHLILPEIISKEPLDPPLRTATTAGSRA